ncbi:cation:proton antiporter [Streptomyces sp. NPDC006476]|uniref:cation:proton antiporter domain-containing protein n=1 Tax=Streptomyces sp. NPDC006476 TaxID=3157175 RepID=UPI0033B14BA0
MTPHQMQFLLLDLALIVMVTRAVGGLFRWLGQPPVLGEITAGILLGPTLFGTGFTQAVFPPYARPLLGALANLGVALFLLGEGIEFDRGLLRGRALVVPVLAVTSVAVPFMVGTGTGFWLFADHETVSRPGFILFMGVAMSITAFPVLARILADRGLNRDRLGAVALSAAALTDVIAWSVFAVVMTVVAREGQQPGRIMLIPVYGMVMLCAVRPLLRRLDSSDRLRSGNAALTIVLTGMLLSALATEWIGLHFLFGAFLFGAVLPRDGALTLRTAWTPGMRRISSTLLLPVYFLLAGLNVDLSSLGTRGFLELAGILCAAVAGKAGTAFVVARLHGMDRREAAVLAALMNTRGLTELIVLTMGVQIGVLDSRLYSVMVVMSLVTTAMAGPVLALLPAAGDQPAWPTPTPLSTATSRPRSTAGSTKFWEIFPRAWCGRNRLTSIVKAIRTAERQR